MTMFTKKSFGTLFAFSLFFFLMLVTIATAEGSKYTPLIGIPGVTNLKTASLGEYLNALYILLISIGGLIGVVKISMAGVKYSMSDIVTDKGEAKKDIVGVLLGLAILLIPAIVLETIYPNLTNLDVLKTAPKVRLEPSRANTGGNVGGGDTQILEQIKNCNAQANSKWDTTCKKCILKTEAAGNCSGGAGGGNPQVTNCSPIPNNPAQAASNCRTFCTGVGGTLSNGDMTCTWKP